MEQWRSVGASAFTWRIGPEKQRQREESGSILQESDTILQESEMKV
jgi:hypothetical protein